MSIDGDLPSISNENWTSINLILYDQFGINWERLSGIFPEWYMKLVWPFTLGKHVSRFLGYTSIELYPEIIEGNPDGWQTRIVGSSSIDEADQGRIYRKTLEVKTDKLAIDYSVTIGLKIVRKDVQGGIAGISYAYIPVKANPFNYLELNAVSPIVKAPPKSIASFEVDITNRGYYEDTFQFKIIGDDGIIGIPTEQAINIKIGETKRIHISILTEEKFFDPGTSHNINIYVFSSKDPNKILVGSVILITEGFFVSPIILMAIIIILIILFFIYFLYKFLKHGKFVFLDSSSRKTKKKKENRFLKVLKNPFRRNDKKTIGSIIEEKHLKKQDEENPEMGNKSKNSPIKKIKLMKKTPKK